MEAVDVHLDRVTSAVDTLVGNLNHLDIGSCDVEQLGRAAAISKKLRARAACLDADIARQRRQLAEEVGDRPVGNVLDPGHQRPGNADQTDIDRAEVLDLFPGVDDATRNGELPAEYADAIAKALKKLSEQQRGEFRQRHPNLEKAAQHTSLEAFKRHLSQLVQKLLADDGVNPTERLRRARTVKFWNDFDTGMGMITAAYDPETWARIKHALNQRANQMYHDSRNDPTDTRTQPPDNGRTDLDVLAPLCTSGPNHHAQWHREHWTGHINPIHRALWITYPDGTTERHPLPRRAA